jgi:hypothetical protein
MAGKTGGGSRGGDHDSALGLLGKSVHERLRLNNRRGMMQGSDAKPVAQGMTESTVEKIPPSESKPDGERNKATADSSSEAPEIGMGVRPVVKDFLSRVVVPMLVERYLAERAAKKPEAKKPIIDSDAPIHRDFFTIQQLAERWSCSRGTVYNILRSTGTKVVDFAAKGCKGRKLVPTAAVEEIER